jgi:hypothetical protein
VATIVESILARSYAFVVVSLRYLIVGGWAAAVVLAIMFFPPLRATSSGGLSDLIPPGSAAARAEADVAHLFGFPIDAAVAIVQRAPHGMPAAIRDRAIRQAIAVDRRLSGQSDGQLAPAAVVLARAGHPDAARMAGPVSPGPPGGIPGLTGAFRCRMRPACCAGRTSSPPRSSRSCPSGRAPRSACRRRVRTPTCAGSSAGRTIMSSG